MRNGIGADSVPHKKIPNHQLQPIHTAELVVRICFKAFKGGM